MEFRSSRSTASSPRTATTRCCARSGLTEPRFEAELQDGLLIEQLRNAVVESAFVAPYELDRRYAIEKQEREIDYALIPTSAFAATVTITDEQMQLVRREQVDDYLLPETVDLQYVELTRAAR